MKSYTDIEQSKKLAEILPIESADFHFSANQSPKGYLEKPIWGNSEYADYSAFPCWSLSALLEVLPNGIVLKKSDTGRYLIGGLLYDNPIDVCVDKIIELKEKDLLW